MKKTILLKRIMTDCGVSRRDMAALVGCCHGTINDALGPKLATKGPGFRPTVERVAAEHRGMSRWLARRDMAVDRIWDEIADPGRIYPYTHGAKISRTKTTPAIVPGDASEYTTHKEAQMISPRTLKHFKMFRSPFTSDVAELRDIYFSEDHLFLKEMMLETARNAGFTAVFGEVGSGKSVIRKAVFHELRTSGVKVIYPQIVDSSRITATALLDAIIMDISEERPKRYLEQKSRQAHKLLRDRANNGLRQILIVEEAHLLNVAAMKALKRINELENGFARLIGVILIGQPELKFLLDETLHPELREVARRTLRAEITALSNGDLGRYLEHKFTRSGKPIGEVMDAGAVAAVAKRLEAKEGRRTVSKGYPLTVNNLVTQAMNMAVEMGEEKVTEEVVMAL